MIVVLYCSEQHKVSDVPRSHFYHANRTFVSSTDTQLILCTHHRLPPGGGGGTPGWGGDFVKNHVENCQFLPPIWGQHC